MKKLLILVIVLSVSSSCFAIPLLTGARDIGQGKVEVMGFLSTNHGAPGYGWDRDVYLDRQGTGLRLTYGINDSFDIFASYSTDTYPNFKNYGPDLNPDCETKQKSGDSTEIAIKYTYLKQSQGNPIDCAVLLEYISSAAQFNISSVSLGVAKDFIMGYSGGNIGLIFSKTTGNMTPYLMLGYGSTNTFEYKLVNTVPAISQSSSLFNIGFIYDISSAWSMALECQYENFWCDKAVKGATVIDPTESAETGLNFGIQYRF